jgi:hypothetical protein
VEIQKFFRPECVSLRRKPEAVLKSFDWSGIVCGAKSGLLLEFVRGICARWNRRKLTRVSKTNCTVAGILT